MLRGRFLAGRPVDFDLGSTPRPRELAAGPLFRYCPVRPRPTGFMLNDPAEESQARAVERARQRHGVVDADRPVVPGMRRVSVPAAPADARALRRSHRSRRQPAPSARPPPAGGSRSPRRCPASPHPPGIGPPGPAALRGPTRRSRRARPVPGAVSTRACSNRPRRRRGRSRQAEHAAPAMAGANVRWPPTVPGVTAGGPVGFARAGFGHVRCWPLLVALPGAETWR